MAFSQSITSLTSAESDMVGPSFFWEKLSPDRPAAVLVCFLFLLLKFVSVLYLPPFQPQPLTLFFLPMTHQMGFLRASPFLSPAWSLAISFAQWLQSSSSLMGPLSRSPSPCHLYGLTNTEGVFPSHVTIGAGGNLGVGVGGSFARARVVPLLVPRELPLSAW